VVTRTLTVSNNPAAGNPPPAAPIQMSASLERTTYGLGGSTVALHREGQETPSGPYIEELYYMHGNHLGSMTLLTDEAGDVVEEARYYPFGGYRLPPTEGITDIGFTGHRQDNLGWENTGLIYMGARYYDPLLRRFISADTIVPSATDTMAYNRFAYVNQNPVNLVDPTGHCANDDAEYWDYLDRLFCVSIYCGTKGWRQWIVVNENSIWTVEELQIVKAAILHALFALARLGIDLRDTGIWGTVFERDNNPLAREGFAGGREHPAFHNPLTSIIRLGNEVFENEYYGMATLFHELGHAIDTISPFADLHDHFQSALGCTSWNCETPERFRFRDYGISEAEGWADAFSAWLYYSWTGSYPDQGQGQGAWHRVELRYIGFTNFTVMTNTVIDTLKWKFDPNPFPEPPLPRWMRP